MHPLSRSAAPGTHPSSHTMEHVRMPTPAQAHTHKFTKCTPAGHTPTSWNRAAATPPSADSDSTVPRQPRAIPPLAPFSTSTLHARLYRPLLQPPLNLRACSHPLCLAQDKHMTRLRAKHPGEGRQVTTDTLSRRPWAMHLSASSRWLPCRSSRLLPPFCCRLQHPALLRCRRAGT